MSDPDRPGERPDRNPTADSGDDSGTSEVPDASEGDPGPASDRRGTLNTVLTVVLALALVAAVGGVVYVAVTPQQSGDTFTEFYVLNADGDASDYPTNLTTGESGEVIVGVSNHEGRSVEYRIEVAWNGTTTTERVVTVPRGETREVSLNLTAPDRPGRYRVAFDLYVNNGSEMRYRYLRLFVNVQDDG